MKYCKHCGKIIEDTATVCPYCTTKQDIAPVSEKSPANGFAIAGFVLSFLGGLLGLIFSILGIVKAPSYGGRGKGLAIAGLVITFLWFVILLFILPS